MAIRIASISNDTELEKLEKRLQFVMCCIDCFVSFLKLLEFRIIGEVPRIPIMAIRIASGLRLIRIASGLRLASGSAATELRSSAPAGGAAAAAAANLFRHPRQACHTCRNAATSRA
jgi:hypothetical protein